MAELSGSKRKREIPNSKRSKPLSGGGSDKSFKSKPDKSFKSKSDKSFKSKPDKPSSAIPPKKEPTTPREKRLAAKEMSEERKKRRKPNYNLEKELASMWEKMRRVNIGKEERSKLISEALRRMNGKLMEIASSHVSARVLQTCVKYCTQSERDMVFEALQPHLLTLSRKKYAVHLVKRLLDNASKKQLELFISSLHGHVAFYLRHSVGSAVVEHVYQLASGPQKRSLLMELYSTELKLFKDLTKASSGRLVDVISKLGLQKSLVVQHMTSVIQPILEKGILDYSIIHTVLVEYFTIADKTSAADVIQHLSPLLVQESSGIDEGQQASTKRKSKKSRTKIPLIVRMMSSRDGLKLGILCIKHGSAKDRKKIIKGIKDHIKTLSLDKNGSLLLTCILSVVDDTKLVTKIVVQPLQTMLKELIFDRTGRFPLLQLLHPQSRSYLGPDNLACLDLSVPSLCSRDDSEEPVVGEDSEKNMNLTVVGKKDPSVRRQELLVGSGLAESLIATCVENASDLLRSNFGKEIIFEVAVGGTNGVLNPLSEKLETLHKAIAALAEVPKKSSESKEDDHVFVNFHASRTIRKLIIESSSFASTLWINALKGKCEKWAHDHSSKVVTAFLESTDSKVRDLAEAELRPLIDRGVLKSVDSKEVKSES